MDPDLKLKVRESFLTGPESGERLGRADGDERNHGALEPVGE